MLIAILLLAPVASQAQPVQAYQEIVQTYADARAMYARRDGVPVYEQPDTTSAVVLRLPEAGFVLAYRLEGPDWWAVATPSQGPVGYVRFEDVREREQGRRAEMYRPETQSLSEAYVARLLRRPPETLTQAELSYLLLHMQQRQIDETRKLRKAHQVLVGMAIGGTALSILAIVLSR